MIEFEADHISLDIPSEGMVKEEWSITPLTAPEVSEVAQPVTIAYLITVQVISKLSCIINISHNTA